MPLHVPATREAETGFVSPASQADVNVLTRQSLGQETITISLPANAQIVRVTAFAIIIALNMANVAKKVKVELEVNGESVFSEEGIIGFPFFEGLTATTTIIQDATDYAIDGDNTIEAFVTQDVASLVRYTVQYTLIVTYRLNT
jgi:hypothetical protein